jgi:hypothetical protein
LKTTGRKEKDSIEQAGAILFTDPDLSACPRSQNNTIQNGADYVCECTMLQLLMLASIKFLSGHLIFPYSSDIHGR